MSLARWLAVLTVMIVVGAGLYFSIRTSPAKPRNPVYEQRVMKLSYSYGDFSFKRFEILLLDDGIAHIETGEDYDNKTIRVTKINPIAIDRVFNAFNYFSDQLPVGSCQAVPLHDADLTITVDDRYQSEYLKVNRYCIMDDPAVNSLYRDFSSVIQRELGVTIPVD